jgi:hypothetical protein
MLQREFPHFCLSCSGNRVKLTVVELGTTSHKAEAKHRVRKQIDVFLDNG